MSRFYRPRSLFSIQGPLLCLIGAISLVFVLQLILSANAFDRFMVVPGNLAGAWEELRSGHFSGEAMAELATLLGYAFLHADFSHVFWNMLYLWVFGALASELLGAKWMLLTFAITAISGGICHAALDPSNFSTMLGASGAVMGFEGLYLGMFVRWRLPDPHVWPIASPVPPIRLAGIAMVYFAMDFMGVMGSSGNIAYGAHLGGFIAGAMLGAAVVPMPRVALPR